MAFLDALSARVSAILTGAYPVGAPYLTADALVAGAVFMPNENPEFPGGTRRASMSRKFDLVWGALGFDPPGSENSTSGPWVRTASLTIRVQYEVARPPKLAPSDRELVLGALELATRRALNDAAAIQWALLRPGAFAGLAIGPLLEEPASAEKVDSLRALGTTRVRFLISQSIETSPGLWT